jgi:hypothetical protein
MNAVKEAAWFALGCVFVLTLIPPLAIIAAVAVIGGHLERG